jgi:phage shock protein C
MYCTKCGFKLEDPDLFCAQCGKPTKPYSPPRAQPAPKRLARSMHEKKLAGVCAGFARYMGVDVTLVRILWLVTVIFGGTGLIAYIIAWIAMPKEYEPATAC